MAPQSQVASEAEDTEFRGRRKIDPWGFVSSAALSDQDLQHALRRPFEAWPSNDITFPLGEPTLTVDRPIFPSGLRNMSPKRTRIRQENDDPISAASTASGAKMVPHWDFRMMGADGQPECPLVPTDFQVWELKNRLIQVNGKRDWAM